MQRGWIVLLTEQNTLVPPASNTLQPLRMIYVSLNSSASRMVYGLEEWELILSGRPLLKRTLVTRIIDILKPHNTSNDLVIQKYHCCTRGLSVLTRQRWSLLAGCDC